MEGRLRGRISEVAPTLAVEEKERLEAAGTLVDLERLTMEIGGSALRPPRAHRERLERAITDSTNHQARMNYPKYRRQGPPLTSSHIESTIKQINARIKGTEKFWNEASGNAILPLRADSLSETRPLDSFWSRWRNRQTDTNAYRKLAN